MNANTTVPAYDYVLFCHINRGHQARLSKFAENIWDVLPRGAQGHSGLLILFFDEGLAYLLSQIHPIPQTQDIHVARTKKNDLKQEIKRNAPKDADGLTVFDRAETFRLDIETEFNKGDSRLVRILTALDLVDIFAEMSNVEDLRKYLIGADGQMRYDTPKFIEAIVRLRMIGSRVPVLRIDEDVLMPLENESYSQSNLTAAILQMFINISLHHQQTQILATILSVSYQVPRANSVQVVEWNRGYATRMLPSLKLPDESTSVAYLQNTKEEQLDPHFHLETTKTFYNSIHHWGAPKTAVISGALLYMSDAVVLNVPPFSNLSHPVMWIDDHLRYVLHREMGDFCRQTVSFGSTNLNVQDHGTRIAKHRKSEKFLLYTLQNYLPTLLWGSIVDYWMCPSYLPKLRVGDVDPKDKHNYQDQRTKGCPGELVKAIREARAGHLPDEGKLRAELTEAAQVRLTSLREIWGALKADGKETLASAWVNNTLHTCIKTRMNEIKDANDFEAMSRLPANIAEFEMNLRKGFSDLVTDTCRYVKWVYEWPRVASVIRAVPYGEFRSDLTWGQY